MEPTIVVNHSELRPGSGSISCFSLPISESGQALTICGGQVISGGNNYGPPNHSTGPTGGDPQNPTPKQDPTDACSFMASVAQTVANTALDFWGNAKDALTAFDMAFSQKYLGNYGLGTTFGSALKFNGTIVHPHIAVLGQDGFRTEFQDNEGDQTHHFVAHLGAGINNQLAAHNLQKLSDFDNPPDLALANAGFKIGQDLRRDPTGLHSIGDRIRNDICDKK